MSASPHDVLTEDIRRQLEELSKKGARWAQLKEAGAGEKESYFLSLITAILEQAGAVKKTPFQQGVAALLASNQDKMPASISIDGSKELDEAVGELAAECNVMLSVLGRIPEDEHGNATAKVQALTQVLKSVTKNINHKISEKKFGASSSGNPGSAHVDPIQPVPSESDRRVDKRRVSFSEQVEDNKKARGGPAPEPAPAPAADMEEASVQEPAPAADMAEASVQEPESVVIVLDD